VVGTAVFAGRDQPSQSHKIAKEVSRFVTLERIPLQGRQSHTASAARPLPRGGILAYALAVFFV
jgi:hypothetical protein